MIKKILMLLLMVAPFSLAAQTTPKFAHFDYAAIMRSMPETKAAQTELEALGKQYQEEILSMEKELQTKSEKYASETPENTPANVLQRHQQELQELYARGQQAIEDNQKSFQEQQTKLMQPIIQKVMDAVNSVAKEGNYVYIVDKNAVQTAGIFINESLNEDVTKKIMAKLGLTALTPAQLPAAAN